MTVGEMIAAHHYHDARHIWLEDGRALAATKLGNAFTMFASAQLAAAQADERLAASEHPTPASVASVQRLWATADMWQRECRTLLSLVIREHGDVA